MNVELFPQLNTARLGDNRQERRLFLPTLIHEESLQSHLSGSARDHAYEIICKWAKLEATGKLQKKKETTLEGEFLTEVFGEALGYTLFSENKDHWDIQAKYTVNGGIADAAIGFFEHDGRSVPGAVIELKGPTANLDRDRFNGRTAVQQCWDYLYELPDCHWGIVCNYVSFRLYHRNQTKRAFELYTLDRLTERKVFDEFYCVFQRGGLLPDDDRRPRADILLIRSGDRQLEVGDNLYSLYSRSRRELIAQLMSKPHGYSLEKAIKAAQKLIDRIIFIAFCEDRGLLDEFTIKRADEQFAAFDLVTNPRWRNFVNLFGFVDKGSKEKRIPPYNGGLFKRDEDIDDLNLSDTQIGFFGGIGRFDFRDEVNVEVLGHLFEKSVNDIERLRLGALFEAEYESGETPRMGKSPERKRSGIYYTPREFTEFITRQTIGQLIEERLAEVAKRNGFDLDERGVVGPSPERARLWSECLDTLRQLKVVDPACGSGAFLIAAYDLLEEKYSEVVGHLEYHAGEPPAEAICDIILRDNIFGVDVTPEAVEISQLSLWLRTARKDKSLADLSQNIICGNSLVDDLQVHPAAMTWQDKFPQVFGRDEKGFDCVIGNPPWERLKLQEREFFDFTSTEIASAVDAATRRKLIAELEKANPDLHQRYTAAKEAADKTLTYVRDTDRFPLTGKGDVNTYTLFAELAHSIVAPLGRVGLLVPSGISTDMTTKEFWGKLVKDKSLVGMYDFENKAPVFADVHRSFKFSILLFGGSKRKTDAADFVFFAHKIEELYDPARHIRLSAKDIKLVNPNTLTCPIFRSQRDAELTKAIYKRVPVLVDRNREEGGNPWGIKFVRMFDQTNDAELFKTEPELKELRCKRHGAHWKKGKQTYLPLYEAKMIQVYDHRAASVVIKDENWMRQGQTADTTPVQHQNPEYVVEPRWWVDEQAVYDTLGRTALTHFVGLKDITSPTNQRTMIAAAIPWSAVTNHFPLLLTTCDSKLEMCLLGNLNSLALDYVTRQKIGGVTLNFFIVEQLPTFPPGFYADRCPWDQRQSLEKWVSNRVLKLTCTSNDMIPLAEAAGLEPPVHPWKPAERADLMAQLDAAYFILYGIKRDDVEHILSTFTGASEAPPDMFGTVSVADKILKHYDHLRSKMGA